MQVNPANLDAMYYGFDARFQAAFEKTAPWSAQIATEVPSSTRENRYHWMDMLPRMREWVGERVIRNLTARVFSITNKPWELTVEVDKDDVEDDNLGVYNGWIDSVGMQARKWPDDVLTDIIQAGTSTVCADGQYFFDTDHPVNIDVASAGTYSNNLTTTPLTASNYGAARAAFGARLGVDGKPMMAKATLLMVPPALEDTARAILNSEQIAPSAAWAGNVGSVAVTNIYRNSADLLVVPELNNEPTTWYLLDVSKPIKPFVWQLRKAPNFVSLFSPTDANVFFRKKFIYGVDSRGNGGFTLPHLALRAIA